LKISHTGSTTSPGCCCQCSTWSAWATELSKFLITGGLLCLFALPHHITLNAVSSNIAASLAEWRVLDRGLDYSMVSVLGAQSSGKSLASAVFFPQRTRVATGTLLNGLFGTRFPTMNADLGRSQTTVGAWLGQATTFEGPHVESSALPPPPGTPGGAVTPRRRSRSSELTTTNSNRQARLPTRLISGACFLVSHKSTTTRKERALVQDGPVSSGGWGRVALSSASNESTDHRHTFEGRNA